MGDRDQKKSLGRPQLFAALLGLCASGAHAGAQPEFCEPGSWAAPKQFPAGSDLEPSDYEWTSASTKQRLADDLRSVDSRREMKAVRQAIGVVRLSYYAMSAKLPQRSLRETMDSQLAKLSTPDGFRRAIEFRDAYGREMAHRHCFQNWNLVADKRLEVDVLRHPDRLAPWRDLYRVRFVREGSKWLFDEVEWLNQRLEAATPASAAP